MALRIFTEQQDTGQVGYATACQLEVFKQGRQRQTGLFCGLLVATLKVAGKSALVNVGYGGIAHRNLICLQ